ncbi:hypothetical protein Tsubulata_008796 [Turnera subulata]|uniref:Deoxyhypusine synthase n=1 Tax=Turnera subulata TaxID=218843 RepID=A0A9Q0GCI7_9ROSI|nr:hypothetical protein Tsubulata_008796 [Turnera subulata]
MEQQNLPSSVHATDFKESENLEGKCTKIEGYDLNQGVNYSQLLKSLATTGFQASNLGDAIDVVNQMLDWRLADEDITEDCSEEEKDPAYRESLRSKGLNRIGNLLVPNDNYCKFEDWIIPIFDQMLKEQIEENVLWTPSKLIARLGKEINDDSSYLYWACKNNIPVFCPGLADGSLGDMLYFHSFRSSGLIVDVVQDIRAMNGEAVHASPRKTGIVILGGGLPKHHICNANMMRNGADYAVFINTAQEFDGSDSGASPDEAISWGIS